ncbi:hypothetical protein [Nocardia concava]|uniref:hypothetical protein n=1 Tax=Nocardia concava TaxID=257281 RepID=UPI0002D99B94|nr:hypothetical protein [Nocardia concava]
MTNARTPAHTAVAAPGHSGALLAGIHTVAVDPGQKHAGMTGELLVSRGGR